MPEGEDSGAAGKPGEVVAEAEEVGLCLVQGVGHMPQTAECQEEHLREQQRQG